MGELYQVKRNTEKAISQYEKILERQPRFTQAYIALGTIYDAMGNRAEARSMYEKALEIDPNFAPAANNLAWLLLQQGDDPHGALDLAKRAAALAPDDPHVADTLGLAFIVNGMYGNAIVELRNATEKMPDNPTVHYHLGLAHFENGDVDEAQEILRKALRISQTFPEKEETRILLAEIEPGER